MPAIDRGPRSLTPHTTAARSACDSVVRLCPNRQLADAPDSCRCAKPRNAAMPCLQPAPLHRMP
eukprot:359189-Chlamydomonas_euryale.AAC.9